MAYDTLFKVIELAETKRLIRENASWQVTCGEITIHPYKNKILEIVKNKCVSFHTNMFIYDEDISKIMQKNEKSYINFSIDAGTERTWAKIKGVDNYYETIDNLKKYRKHVGSGNRFFLKYIIIPDMNDLEDDYISLILLMNDLEINHLIISRDVNRKYSEDANKKKLINGAAMLMKLCSDNNISVKLESSYTESDQKMIYESIGLIWKKKNYISIADGYVDSDF